MPRRRICFVTGTRAEYGLMRSTLEGIRARRGLELQIIATGMHLSRSHGYSVANIRRDGFVIDQTVPWRSADGLAAATLKAGAKIAAALRELDPDIVLVTGDRVEAFAAAAAAHLDGRIVAHVHGGDRALGQCDDTLRHAITKLAHVHFPATRKSAERIFRLGEEQSRIVRVGTPGLDEIVAFQRQKNFRTVKSLRRSAIAILHPESPDESIARQQARMLLTALQNAKIPTLLIDPNNDPGWRGIVAAYDSADPSLFSRVANLSRTDYLAALSTTGLLIGNSSSGIIEAASFGVRVVNVGRRQQGREQSANVSNVAWEPAAMAEAIEQGVGQRFSGANVYGRGGAGVKIAKWLSDLPLTRALRQKLIHY